MKFARVIAFLLLLFSLYACMVHRTNRQQLHELAAAKSGVYSTDSFVYIPPSPQPVGNAEDGFKFLTTGDYISSGLPAGLYNWMMADDKRSLLKLAGFNKYIIRDFNVYEVSGGNKIAAPTCLHCHASAFGDKVVLGLGNSYSYYTYNSAPYLKAGERIVKMLFGRNSSSYKNSKQMFSAGKHVAPLIVTEAMGTNPGERLAEILAAHRDPITLNWTDERSFATQQALVPTDVPAWWLLKKKNGIYYNAKGRGDYSKQLMAAILLTLNDTVSASRIQTRMKDVVSYMMNLQPPKYPYSINESLAKSGKALFDKTCSRCHGTYGEDEQYPNLLVSQKIIGTDSLLAKQYMVQQGYINWYNNSWFNKGDERSWLQAEYGYLAPPLDGVWITAPYFHNGSVPTIEGVLNSDVRPTYWLRNFNRSDYDYAKVGWKYEEKKRGHGNKMYNTTIPGYGNYGHYFGDILSDEERKAVIEYLKTL